uniref:Nudix hydrolase domain-containing protein n=2 Tax=Guillardia theta TaxID=55529 RepID=A0A7S4KLI1_GUITH|mmetsp:Transcript_26456/g.86932  ORF Transcript_26456/g.86932 Transcript_26456/m.86932 type:complete len:584 (+) Transcript_26456:198-1949(+)
MGLWTKIKFRFYVLIALVTEPGFLDANIAGNVDTSLSPNLLGTRFIWPDVWSESPTGCFQKLTYSERSCAPACIRLRGGSKSIANVAGWFDCSSGLWSSCFNRIRICVSSWRRAESKNNKIQPPAHSTSLDSIEVQSDQQTKLSGPLHSFSLGDLNEMDGMQGDEENRKPLFTTKAHTSGKVPEYEVLLDCLPNGVTPEKVQVVLHRKYCRTRHPDVEKGIEDQWQSLTTKEPRLWWYDGTLFRLASAQRWKDIDGSQEVKLECGVTRYRSFLGTNMSPNWAKIPEVHMSDPLSCFVLVHSSDDQVMFVQRKDPILGSSISLPGGHLSADRAGIFDSMVEVPIPGYIGHEIICMLDYSIWPGSEKWKPSMRNGVESPRPYSKVITELFSCPLREANGDLGLKSNDFFELPLMLGIAKSSRNRTIAAVFYLATHLTAEEIKEKHSQSALPHSCRCISISDKDALPTLDLDLQPCCRAALYLFAQYLRTHRGAHVRNGGGITDLKQDGEEMTSFPSKGTYLREAEGRGRSMQKNQFAVFSNKSEDPGEAVVEEGSLSVADVRSLSPRHLDAVKYSNLQVNESNEL